MERQKGWGGVISGERKDRKTQVLEGLGYHIKELGLVL